MNDMQAVTLQYYNNHAREFAEQTQHVDFGEIQQEYIKLIPDAGHILDFGCGAGRDSRYFLSHGYRVTALDGSHSLALLAEDYIQQKVVRQSFEDFSAIDAYDGIWACASLLHLPWNTLRQVVWKLAAALHSKGILYASFKYGNFTGMRHGRYFMDMTEERWQVLTEGMTAWHVLKIWVTGDVREGRSDQWLNILCKKQ